MIDPEMEVTVEEFYDLGEKLMLAELAEIIADDDADAEFSV